MNVTLQNKQDTQRNVILFGIAFWLFFIGFLSIENTSAVEEDISGQVMYEDRVDDDWNDLVTNCEGSMTWTSKANGEVNRVTMNCMGTSCGACNQNKWAINMPCDGSILVERAGAVISSNKNAVVGQKVTIADSFCRDMFINGAICKFNNDFENGLTADITIICNTNYTSPTDGSAHYFSLAQLFAVDPHGDGNWDTDSSTDTFTASVDSVVDKFLHLYLPQTIIPMALATNVFTTPSLAEGVTGGFVCGERNNYGDCSGFAGNNAVINACNGNNTRECRKVIEDQTDHSQYESGAEMENFCNVIKSRVEAGTINSAIDFNCGNGQCSDNRDNCDDDNDCNTVATCEKNFLAMFPPKANKRFFSIPMHSGENGSNDYRYELDNNGYIKNHQWVSNGTVKRKTSCHSNAINNCNENDYFGRMGISQNKLHGANTKHGCCPEGWTFEHEADGCFCTKSIGGNNNGNNGNGGPPVCNESNSYSCAQDEVCLGPKDGNGNACWNSGNCFPVSQLITTNPNVYCDIHDNQSQSTACNDSNGASGKGRFERDCTFVVIGGSLQKYSQFDNSLKVQDIVLNSSITAGNYTLDAKYTGGDDNSGVPTGQLHLYKDGTSVAQMSPDFNWPDQMSGGKTFSFPGYLDITVVGSGNHYYIGNLFNQNSGGAVNEIIVGNEGGPSFGDDCGGNMLINGGSTPEAYPSGGSDCDYEISKIPTTDTLVRTGSLGDMSNLVWAYTKNGYFYSTGATNSMSKGWLELDSGDVIQIYLAEQIGYQYYSRKSNVITFTK